MPLGYKYVERDADSQINYFDLGQQAVGMLQDWQQGREEKKEAYRQAYRESINNLMEAPQGKDQTANDFISDFTQSMITQQTVNKKLLESGRMSEKQYTLSLQNQMDGTKRLFNLQKLYQDNFESTMKDMNDKKIQRGLTTFNQRTIEGAANFNNSKTFIDPIDGTVNVGLMENKVIDGKLVKVLNKNTAASTDVWTGRVLQKPIYFDVDTNTKGFVDGLGKLKVAVYDAANTLKAGTITDLTGLEFVKTIKDPATKAIVTEFNKSIDAEAESYLSPLNVASILTDDLRKYNDESFTFDRDEADKDPKKILVTIDPVAKMTTLDKTGKNYEAQKKEAFDYVRNQIISKIDEEKKISTTGQLDESARARAAAEAAYRSKTDDEKKAEDAKNFAVNTSNFLYGTDEQKAQAIPYFAGMGAVIKVNPKGKPKGNYILNPNGEYVLLNTENGDTTAGGRAAIGVLLTATGQDFPQDMVFKNMRIGKSFNTTYSGTGIAKGRDYNTEVKAKIKADEGIINSELFNSKSKDETAPILIDYFKNADEIQVVPSTKWKQNDIEIIYSPKNRKLKGSKVKLNSNEAGAVAKGQYSGLVRFINSLPDSVKEQFLGPEPGTEETTGTTKGVGSKY